MKTLINLILLISFLSNLAFADCDFSKGIIPGPNNTYIYSEACHKKVGQLVQDNAIKDAQIKDLNSALTLKDLALTKSDSRVTLWQNTSASMEDRLNKIDSMEKTNQWLYFSLGALTVIGAGYMASQLIRH